MWGSTWILAPALEPRAVLPMDKHIAVGFGAAYVTRDGETVWQESNHDWNECWTVHRAELEASADSDHDWCIHLIGPLYEGHFQRQAPSEWVMYKRGDGFA